MTRLTPVLLRGQELVGQNIYKYTPGTLSTSRGFVTLPILNRR
jgi:hypothetical protein